MLEAINRKRYTIVRWLLVFPVFIFHDTGHKILFLISLVLLMIACFREGYEDGLRDGVRGAISKINSEIDKFRKEEANGKINRDENIN